MRMRRYPIRAIKQIIPHPRPLAARYDLLVVVHRYYSVPLLMPTQAFPTFPTLSAITVCKLRTIQFRLYATAANARLWSTITTSFCVRPTITAKFRVWRRFTFQCSPNPGIWSKCIWSATGCTCIRPVSIWCGSAFATSECFRTICTWTIRFC